MPRQQMNRMREKNDPSAFNKKPMLDEHKNTKLQMEWPATYAPLPDEQSSSDQAREAAEAEVS